MWSVPGAVSAPAPAALSTRGMKVTALRAGVPKASTEDAQSPSPIHYAYTLYSPPSPAATAHCRLRSARSLAALFVVLGVLRAILTHNDHSY